MISTALPLPVPGIMPKRMVLDASEERFTERWLLGLLAPNLPKECSCESVFCATPSNAAHPTAQPPAA